VFIGLIIFAAAAVLCIVAFASMKKRARDYDEGESPQASLPVE
jgi:hypothetical protein